MNVDDHTTIINNNNNNNSKKHIYHHDASNEHLKIFIVGIIFIIWEGIVLYPFILLNNDNDRHSSWLPYEWTHLFNTYLKYPYWILKLYIIVIHDPDDDPLTTPPKNSILSLLSTIRVTEEFLQLFFTMTYPPLTETILACFFAFINILEYYHDICIRQVRGYRSYHSMTGMILRSLSMGNIAYIADQPTRFDERWRMLILIVKILFTSSWFALVDHMAFLQRNNRWVVPYMWIVFAWVCTLSSYLGIGSQIIVSLVIICYTWNCYLVKVSVVPISYH